MPEGHVIHWLANDLNQAFAGQTVQVFSPQGRFDPSPLTNAEQAALFEQAEAVGKHLFLHFDAGIIHIHLGLIGKLFVRPLQSVTGIVRLRITNGQQAADLHGPQWCKLISAAQYESTIAAQGADPLLPQADPQLVLAKAAKSQRPIASLLMDQKLFAGVGNIYRAEVLFRHGLNPMLPGKQLSAATWQELWADLVVLMAAGVKQRRIDTVRPEHLPEVMGRAPREDAHGGEVYVYRRAGEPCLVCGTSIAVTKFEGRNLFWCPTCQH